MKKDTESTQQVPLVTAGSTLCVTLSDVNAERERRCLAAQYGWRDVETLSHLFSSATRVSSSPFHNAHSRGFAIACAKNMYRAISTL